MSQRYVGTTLISDEAVLKQAALLFDTVMLPPEWVTFQSARDNMVRLCALDSTLDKLFRPVPVDPLPDGSLGTTELSKLALANAIESLDEASRRWAIRAQQQQPENVVLPLVHSISWTNLAERKQRVIRLVLNELPLPDAATPWRAIAEWRSDDDARRKYRRLRTWISSMTRSDLPEGDIADGLATLLDDYVEYMSLQHKRLTRSRAEVILTAAAGIVEDLARVRLSAVVQRMFGMLKEETALLTAELEAPGREIAYVAVTKKRFQS
jgi:hypothetical protein